jgi:hypothetical protein
MRARLDAGMQQYSRYFLAEIAVGSCLLQVTIPLPLSFPQNMSFTPAMSL